MSISFVEFRFQSNLHANKCQIGKNKWGLQYSNFLFLENGKDCDETKININFISEIGFQSLKEISNLLIFSRFRRFRRTRSMKIPPCLATSCFHSERITNHSKISIEIIPSLRSSGTVFENSDTSRRCSNLYNCSVHSTYFIFASILHSFLAHREEKGCVNKFVIFYVKSFYVKSFYIKRERSRGTYLHYINMCLDSLASILYYFFAIRFCCGFYIICLRYKICKFDSCTPKCFS